MISGFRSASVVFHGYPEIPTIKDNTHKRRVGKGISPRLEFEPDMLFQAKKDVFLSNIANKQSIINVISTEHKKAGCYVIHSNDDTDVGIVKLAVQSSLEYPTTVIGECTDLLRLLLSYADVNSKPLNHCKSDEMEIHNILHFKTTLRSEIYTKLLFLRVFTGCDTTSSVHGVGKATVFNKLISNKHLQAVALVFTAQSIT